MDNNKIYVGNLPWSIDSDQLKKAFLDFGNIVDAVVVTDRQTGRSRGFGFVEYEDAESAQKAIDEMNGKELDGRKLVVNISRPKAE